MTLSFFWILFLILLVTFLLVRNLVMAWSLPFLGVMFGLPIHQYIPNSNYFIYLLQLTGICASIRLFYLAQNSEIKQRLKTSIFLMSYLSVIGIVIGRNVVSLIVALQGVKLLLLPILLSIGAVSDRIRWDRIFKVLVVLSSVQISVAIGEYFIGVSKLMDLGLVYGTQIRQIEGQLRAPALFSTHFEFGLFCAALFSASIYANEIASRIGRMWIKFGIFFGIFGAILSTARTALLIVCVVFMIKKIESSEIPNRFLIRLFRLGAISAFFILLVIFLPSVVTSKSLFSRFENWASILGSFNVFLGGGIGIAGGATNSNFADISKRIVVDNYILSLLVQVGVLGLVLFLMSLKNYSFPKPQISPILASVLLSFFTLESWEYYGSISIMLILQIRLLANLEKLRE